MGNPTGVKGLNLKHSQLTKSPSIQQWGCHVLTIIIFILTGPQSIFGFQWWNPKENLWIRTQLSSSGLICDDNMTLIFECRDTKAINDVMWNVETTNSRTTVTWIWLNGLQSWTKLLRQWHKFTFIFTHSYLYYPPPPPPSLNVAMYCHLSYSIILFLTKIINIEFGEREKSG